MGRLMDLLRGKPKRRFVPLASFCAFCRAFKDDARKREVRRAQVWLTVVCCGACARRLDA